MKKLITNINGGMPDLLDNTRWMESGLVEAIEGICRGLGMQISSYKIFGAKVIRIGTSVSVTQGIIYHNGELFNVVPASFTAPVEHEFYWQRADVYDPSGLFTFQNGQQHNIYLNKQMVLLHAFEPPQNPDIIWEEHIGVLEHMLVTAEREVRWNNMLPASDVTPTPTGNRVLRLNASAQMPASVVAQTATERFVTDAEKRQTRPSIVVLSQANPVWDVSLGFRATLVLNANRTLSFSNVQEGDAGVLLVTNSGNFSLSFPANRRFAFGINTIQQPANSITMITFVFINNTFNFTLTNYS